jgi:hypothetical protein
MMRQDTLERNVNDFHRLSTFLNTRRNDQTREYTRLILEKLRGKKEVDIRSVLNELVPEHIPNESTFFRIIKDLSNPEWGILERREDPTIIRRGKAPVFYKLKIHLHWPGRLPPPVNQIMGSDIVTRVYGELAIAKEIIASDRKISPKEVDVLIQRDFVKKWGHPQREDPELLPYDEEDT